MQNTDYTQDQECKIVLFEKMSKRAWEVLEKNKQINKKWSASDSKWKWIMTQSTQQKQPKKKPKKGWSEPNSVIFPFIK